MNYIFLKFISLRINFTDVFDDKKKYIYIYIYLFIYYKIYLDFYFF